MEKDIIKLICPSFVVIPRKTKKDKKVYININIYRNLHYLVESKCKKAFKEAIRDQVEGFTMEGEVEVTYQVFKHSRRKMDKMNVVSIVSKYALDALVELKCLQDDNDDIIKTEHLLPTVYDKENPRIEITISKVKI
jgi:hypothetical protein